MTETTDSAVVPRRLIGRSALVTGGAQGIGAATARRLAREGAVVTVLDIDADRGSALVRELAAEGASAMSVCCDVRVEAEVTTSVAAAAQHWGRIDVLVNNAGVNSYFDAETMAGTDWDSVFAIDVKAAWLTAKHALPHLLVSRHASIVNISSIHGRLTTAGMFPYAAAKSAIEGLTRSLALDYGPRGVRVNAVAPGWTRTALVEDWLAMQPNAEEAEAQLIRAHPLARIATPQDIAAVIVFLASDDAAAITGTVVAADCGLGARQAI